MRAIHHESRSDVLHFPEQLQLLSKQDYKLAVQWFTKAAKSIGLPIYIAIFVAKAVKSPVLANTKKHHSPYFWRIQFPSVWNLFCQWI